MKALMTVSVSLVCVLISPSLGAQRPTPAVAGGTPAFEVISIKRNVDTSPDKWGMRAFPGGRVNIFNLSLKTFIANIYGVRPYLVIGGPEWMGTHRFDIDAKAPADTQLSSDVLMQMNRQTLADRFKLSMHLETREMPIYELVMAKADRTLGPNIRPSSVDCAALAREAIAAGKPVTNNSNPDCMSKSSPGYFYVGGQCPPIGTIADLVGRTVVDRTGLNGHFTCELTFTPDQGLGASAPPDALSIFAALEEQLGFKLQSTQGPVPVMVIDHVEPPEEN